MGCAVANKTGRCRGPTGQHKEVARCMTVRGMRQRTDDRPPGTPLRQPWQMFADIHPGRRGRDGGEFSTDLGRRFRLQIEAFMLSQSTRQKDIDARLGPAKARAGTAGICSPQVTQFREP